MTGCVNEDDVELSLGLAIGSGGRLRKCSEDVLKKDGILGRQEARKKQEVRRGAVLVDEDERVRKKAKSEFCFEWVDEGGGIFSSGDCESLSGQRKCPSHIAQVAAAGVKKQIVCSGGLNNPCPNDEKLVGLSSISSAPTGAISNLNGQIMSSQSLMNGKEGVEMPVVLPFIPLAKMPCVSTTGSGPGGKTARGFLYRYTKEEVCIVCFCHGFLLSPAKFVEHAGGRNVESPLRHITITPFPSLAP